MDGLRDAVDGEVLRFRAAVVALTCAITTEPSTPWPLLVGGEPQPRIATHDPRRFRVSAHHSTTSSAAAR